MSKFMTHTLAATLLLFPASVLSADDEDKSKARESAETQTVDITVNETVVVDDDGEKKTNKTVSGRIIIKGPDGKVEEFEIGDKLPMDIDLNIIGGKDGLAAWVAGGANAERFTFQATEPRYMIGVICEPASDTLKSHLKLDDGGLVVTTVSEKMPAAEAGIQVHDVLLQIGDAKLTDVKQLLELVADSDGEELEVWALRGGEKMSVKVTPKKSTAKAAMAYLLSGDSGDPDKHDHLIRRWSDKAGGPRWIVGPGLRLDVDAKVDVEEKIAEAREKALLHRRKHAMESEEKLERAYEKAQALRADQDLQIKRSQQHEAELQKQLKSLRKQQAELLKRLKALEENQSEE